MENKYTLLNQFEPTIESIPSNIVSDGTFRLDSQYYALFENNILNLKADNFLDFKECCLSIYEVPPFKHIYVNDGIPFYTSSGLFDNESIPSHFLTSDMPNISKYFIKKGQILMARSGNVESGILGQIMVVGDLLNNTTTSDHVLRFTPNATVINSGYLAAFLMSDFCKGQLLKNASGAVIPAIRPQSLMNLQIPIIDNTIQEKIGSLIITSLNSREKAINLIKRSRLLVLEYNELPDILKNEENKTIFNKDNILIRETNLSEFTIDFRLDAHFYNPIAELVVKNIKEFSFCYKNLFDIADCSFKGSRSTRNYVDKTNGIPFLSGKNIIQIRPDLKYVSKTETSNLDDMIVEKNQILISRSGTLGRTVFVWNNYENFAASEHLIRVSPNPDLIDEGYLYAFLSSDYGYHQLLRYKHGSVIDEITEGQISQSIIPIPSEKQQKEIGDLVREAYDLRAEAIRLEDEAQAILTEALT